MKRESWERAGGCGSRVCRSPENLRTKVRVGMGAFLVS